MNHYEDVKVIKTVGNTLFGYIYIRVISGCEKLKDEAKLFKLSGYIIERRGAYSLHIFEVHV